IGLEQGDTIVALDDAAIRSPQDVLAHVDRTTVDLIDVRTNQLKRAVVMLPSQGPAPVPASGRGPAGLTQPVLRAVLREELLAGFIKYEEPHIQVDGPFLVWSAPIVNFGAAEVGFAVSEQARVEVIRITRCDQDPRKRAFWRPYLDRMEQLIAAELD